MKASYISYFEGYDENGRVVFNGNGSCTVEYDEVEGIDPGGLLESHQNHLLGVAREKNPYVVRVVINNIARL